MTEKTSTFGLRLPKEIKAKLTGKMTRECLEGIARQLDAGEIELNENGIKCFGASEYQWIIDEFLEISHDANVDPRVMMRKLKQMARM